MKIVEPKIELLWITENPLQVIEKSARTCYKSESAIKEGSAEIMVKKLVELGHTAMLEHATASYRVTTDRGVSHEIVRHRAGCSYAQESTRYCNYNNKGMEFIRPSFWEKDSKEYADWETFMSVCEIAYIELISNGATPEQARSVLPNSLKTEIVMTFNFRAWLHFFNLRTALTAHPDIRVIANLLRNDLRSQVSCIF